MRNTRERQLTQRWCRRQSVPSRAKLNSLGDDTRPEITIGVDEQRINDRAIAALAGDNSIFQRGGMLVHVVADAGDTRKAIWRARGSPKIGVLRPPVLREHLAAVARWLIQKQDGAIVPAHPPAWSVNAVFHRENWPNIRPLEGVVTGPILRPDGTILASSEYDPQTGLLCQMDLTIPEIPNAPSRHYIHEAMWRLKGSVADFPFEKPAHEATWVALLLTLLARPAFPGPAPLFLLDANVRGSGKGLLFDLATTIATGRHIPRTPSPTNKEETRKLILSLALEGDPAILLDNAAGNFGNAALEAALTSTRWRDRILGRSQTGTFPLTVVWAATGNNVNLTGDMSRRVANIRLRTMLENPEERTDFQHPRLLDWAASERGELLAAALTVLRGYCAAGRPNQRLAPWGSYEGWSDLVRSSVVWAGLPDPGETRKKASRHDVVVQSLDALLIGLKSFDPGGNGLTSSDIIRRVATAEPAHSETAEMVREALAFLCETSASDLPGPHALGMKLASFRERVVGDRYLDHRIRNHTSAWFVAQIGKGGSGGSGAISGRQKKQLPADRNSNQ